MRRVCTTQPRALLHRPSAPQSYFWLHGLFGSLLVKHCVEMFACAVDVVASCGSVLWPNLASQMLVCAFAVSFFVQVEALGV